MKLPTKPMTFEQDLTSYQATVLRFQMTIVRIQIMFLESEKREFERTLTNLQSKCKHELKVKKGNPSNVHCEICDKILP